MRETLGVTDRAYIMAEGRIFRSGQPQDLTEDAEVRRLYHLDRGYEAIDQKLSACGANIIREKDEAAAA